MTLEKIVISVIIPVYNRHYCIQRAIDSILEQDTKTSFEIVVVDDGSQDGTAEVVNSINDNRVRLIKQKNSGAAKARYNGVINAHGEKIAFLDSDDVALPNYLSDLENALTTNNDAILAYGRVEELNSKSVIKQPIPNMNGNNILDDSLIALIDHGCFTVSMNLMVYKEFALKAMSERAHMIASNDYDFCLRVATFGNFLFVNKTTLLIDRRSDGISAKNGYIQFSHSIIALNDVLDFNSLRKNLVQKKVTEKISELWPSAFMQCLAHKDFPLALKILKIAFSKGRLFKIKDLYWSFMYYIIKSRK